MSGSSPRPQPEAHQDCQKAVARPVCIVHSSQIYNVRKAVSLYDCVHIHCSVSVVQIRCDVGGKLRVWAQNFNQHLPEELCSSGCQSGIADKRRGCNVISCQKLNLYRTSSLASSVYAQYLKLRVSGAYLRARWSRSTCAVTKLPSSSWCTLA